MKFGYVVILFCIISIVGFAQQNCVIATYNILNYPGSDTTSRNPNLRVVMSSINPDILVVQEITSQTGVDGFLEKVMNSFGETYAAGIFINGLDTDNAVFYKTTKFSFLSNTPIKTELRDINEFTLEHTNGIDTVRLYSVHLKASSGSTNEQKRAREVDSLRKVLDTLHADANYIVLGDFNIYVSSEPAYQNLLNQTNSGYVLDPINRPGSWHNNISFADIHTQSPRTRQFGGGSNGGIDDRFDMMLISESMSSTGGISYVPDSYTTYGNDGNHFNDSINAPPNAVVTQQIADALHYSSDHIPVYATFLFNGPLPVELVKFEGKYENSVVTLSWITATEVSNYGFDIERSIINSDWVKIEFINGYGNSNSVKYYSFVDRDVGFGEYYYRLKQIDTDGTFQYSEIIKIKTLLPSKFILSQNYPNPFNPVTNIGYYLPYKSYVTLKVFDVLGNKVATLVDGEKPEGNYEIEFSSKGEANGLTSGAYFYQLQAVPNGRQAGSFIETKKMILLR